MKVGIPKEVKVHEYRVAITPAGVQEFIKNNHTVLIEKSAGLGSGISDQEFIAAGAKIVDDPNDIWKQSELILKVKEPIDIEYAKLREDQVLFTYLHLAASRKCTEALLNSNITAIAYETVEDNNQHLPLLAPMSEVAGRLATQVGAQILLKFNNGSGVLLAGVPGVAPAKVIVIGAGIAGTNAAKIALGMGADVTVVDTNINRLREIDSEYQGRIKTLFSSHYQLQNVVKSADLVIGAVLVPGTKAPKLVTNEMVSQMKTGSVLVDIAIDQGGCFEDSKPTTHAEPTFPVHNSIFYCVANMPGAVPNTSTYALTNATLPYSLKIANQGFKVALKQDVGLSKGLHTHKGFLTQKAVADEFRIKFIPPSEVLD